MKKLMGLLLLSILFVFPLCANATIIGNVNLTLNASTPHGNVTLFGVTQDVYFDYDAALNGGAYTEAFCVENANAVNGSTNPYTLLAIDSSLASYFAVGSSTPSRLLQAVAIAQYFYTNKSQPGDLDDTWKAAAQIAIWEVMFDSTLSSDADLVFGSGNFIYSGDVTLIADAQFIWDAVKSSIPTSSTEWALAVSPTITAEQKVTVADQQNYLVRNSKQVPEPASLLLFGLGLLGLAGVGRKMKK